MGRVLEGRREVPAKSIVDGVEVVSTDDVAILSDILGDPGDGPCFLIVDGLVEEQEGVLDF